MHTTGCAHLTNYELYSSSLFISLYEDKNVQEKKFTFYFTDLWVCQWYLSQEVHEFSKYIKLNNWFLLNATIYMLYNNSGSEI